MTKREWKKHIDECLPQDIKRPCVLKGNTSNLEKYRTWLKNHAPECPQCAARKRTHDQVGNGHTTKLETHR